MREYYSDKKTERALIRKVRRQHRRYFPAMAIAISTIFVTIAVVIGIWLLGEADPMRDQRISVKTTLIGAITATSAIIVALSGGKAVIPAREGEVVILKGTCLYQTFQVGSSWRAEERSCKCIENVIELDMAKSISYNEKLCRLEIMAPYTQIRHLNDGTIETKRKESRPFYLYAYYTNWKELKSSVMATNVLETDQNGVQHDLQ